MYPPTPYYEIGGRFLSTHAGWWGVHLRLRPSPGMLSPSRAAGWWWLGPKNILILGVACLALACDNSLRAGFLDASSLAAAPLRLLPPLHSLRPSLIITVRSSRPSFTFRHLFHSWGWRRHKAFQFLEGCCLAAFPQQHLRRVLHLSQPSRTRLFPTSSLTRPPHCCSSFLNSVVLRLRPAPGGPHTGHLVPHFFIPPPPPSPRCVGGWTHRCRSWLLTTPCSPATHPATPVEGYHTTDWAEVQASFERGASQPGGVCRRPQEQTPSPTAP